MKNRPPRFGFQVQIRLVEPWRDLPKGALLFSTRIFDGPPWLVLDLATAEAACLVCGLRSQGVSAEWGVAVVVEDRPAREACHGAM